MTDRELLEFAAKACGEITHGWHGNQDYLDGVLSRWNPLKDDGDALRLAVKLHLCAEISGEYTFVYSLEHRYQFKVSHYDDAEDATRRAITRVAAEIGKGMK